MAKSFPAGCRSQPAHLRKRKCATKRKPGVKSRHRLPVNAEGQQIDADDPDITPFQVGDQIRPSGHGPGVPQKANACVICEVMQGQRTEYEIGRTCWRERQHVRDGEGYFGIRARTLLRQFKCGGLKVNGRDSRTDIVGSAPIDHDPGNIAEPGTQIDRRDGTARREPALKEMPDQPITSEILIQLLKIFEVGQQFRRYILRPIHHFERCVIERPRANE